MLIQKNSKMAVKRKVLVTGGTGYIGSHTVVELINKGYEVYIVDNLSNSRSEVLQSIEKITGVRPFFANIDLNDKVALNDFLKKYRVDAIIRSRFYKQRNE